MDKEISAWLYLSRFASLLQEVTNEHLDLIVEFEEGKRRVNNEVEVREDRIPSLSTQDFIKIYKQGREQKVNVMEYEREENTSELDEVKKEYYELDSIIKSLENCSVSELANLTHSLEGVAKLQDRLGNCSDLLYTSSTLRRVIELIDRASEYVNGR